MRGPIDVDVVLELEIVPEPMIPIAFEVELSEYGGTDELDRTE